MHVLSQPVRELSSAVLDSVPNGEARRAAEMKGTFDPVSQCALPLLFRISECQRSTSSRHTTTTRMHPLSHHRKEPSNSRGGGEVRSFRLQCLCQARDAPNPVLRVTYIRASSGGTNRIESLRVGGGLAMLGLRLCVSGRAARRCLAIRDRYIAIFIDYSSQYGSCTRIRWKSMFGASRASPCVYGRLWAFQKSLV
jgi:hypothetical protein